MTEIGRNQHADRARPVRAFSKTLAVAVYKRPNLSTVNSGSTIVSGIELDSRCYSRPYIAYFPLS
jgi:hypothetical protein